MKNPFIENGKLKKETSINRLKIVDIPNIDIDFEVKGKFGYELFSNDILIEYIKRDAHNLNLDIDSIQETEYSKYLNECLDSTDLKIKETAENIIRRLGRNLGYILLTLKRGDRINQEVRKEWTEKHWNYWKKTENLIFTGGLCNGNIGKLIKHHIEEVFEESKTQKYNITISKNPSLISIIGASRHLPQCSKSGLVFDFGQTLIKRAMVNFNKDRLDEIYEYPTIEAKFVDKMTYYSLEDEKEDAEKLSTHIVDTIITTWNKIRKREINISNKIMISIADNLVNGKLSAGGYAKLRLIAADYKKYLSEKLRCLTGEGIEIYFIHDGTSAADSFAETENSIMITLGTALGLGFPEEKEELRKISKHIKIKRCENF